TVLFTTLATDTDIQLIHREIMANSKIMSNPTHLEHIGSNIKELRRFRKLTQQELAEAAGLRLATISDIELGKANFQFNTLVRIASALNCYLDISFTPTK